MTAQTEITVKEDVITTEGCSNCPSLKQAYFPKGGRWIVCVDNLGTHFQPIFRALSTLNGGEDRYRKGECTGGKDCARLKIAAKAKELGWLDYF